MNLDVQNPADPDSCQLCGEGPLDRFEIPDWSVLWHCRRCDLYQYGRMAESSEYEAEYHHGYQRKRDQKLRTAMIRLNRISAVCRTRRPRMIEVGCSVGCTVQAARMRGWDAVGVDVSQDAVNFCRDLGLNCQVVGPVELPFPSCSFDVLTSWHVIEHVADVRETLREWTRVLKPGGLLVMETPDATCPKVRRLGARYRKFWAPEHTYTFTPDNLARFVEQAGLETVGQPVLGRMTEYSIPMAFYSVFYQSYQGLRTVAGINKAFQIFARKPDSQSQEASHYREAA